MGAVSYLGQNLLYLLWRENVDRMRWREELAAWLGCDLRRAEDLLEGRDSELRPGERKALAKKTGFDPKMLRTQNLVTDENVHILRENLRYLIESLPHGRKKEFAKSVGVDAATVSRWHGGTLRPGKAKLLAICRYFGCPSGTDLARDPLFLATEPVGENQMRTWLRGELEGLDAATLRQMFPALARLLRRR